MNALRIVAEYLEKNGYDGLYNDDCGCELSDLAPCGDLGGNCRPGYRTTCICGDHDFHIGKDKQQRDADVDESSNRK